jgi:hypothetical protein
MIKVNVPANLVEVHHVTFRHVMCKSVIEVTQKVEEYPLLFVARHAPAEPLSPNSFHFSPLPSQLLTK